MEMYDPHRSGVRRRVTGGVDNPAMRYDGTTGHVEPVNGTAYEPGMNGHVHRTVSCNNFYNTYRLYHSLNTSIK